ncbi:MAG: SLC13 family permease [Gammaproteobacteria bacterium]
MNGGALQAAAVLNAHGAAMLVFAVAFFALLVWDRLPIATVCLGMLGVLSLAFAVFPLVLDGAAVDPLRFFAGFGHPALVAICSLMILGQGFVITGALEPAARRLAAWVAASPRAALLAVLVGAGAASGVLNDTPVVVLLIPLIIGAAARANAEPAAMLMPINYAVLIGGMATTIGTSTNLIVVAIAAGLGVGPFGVFSFFTLVMLAAIPAWIYLWLVAPRLLAHVRRPAEDLTSPVFEAEVQVDAGSWLDGRELREVFEAAGGRLNLIEIRRGQRRLTRLPTLKLRAGDRLHVQDLAPNLKDLEASLKATLHEEQDEVAATAAATASTAAGANVVDGSAGAEAGAQGGADPSADASSGKAPAKAPSKAIVAQMIVTPESPLVGRTARQERIPERFGVLVVGLKPKQPRADWQRRNPAERVVAAGDILLVQGEEASIRQAQREGVGLLLDAQFALPRQDKSLVVMLTMAAVVVLAATKWLPIALAAPCGVAVLLLSRAMSWHDVARSLSVKVILLVTASLALGDALDLSGATAFLAHQLAAHTQGMSPAWVLALLMALMGLMTNFVSNNASAAIGTPLGIELARLLGVPPEPFVLAVLFGCNLCYMTPMGYQTNLLVMNAAGYRFGDFVRVGAPLFLIMWGALSYGLMHRYGL